jgi:hypothetical protein
LPYKYSIDSWKHWTKKYDAELFTLTELLFDIEEMGICWQRYYLFDILEANNIEYDQILMVDADTIVHPDCPNFFEMTEHKYTGVQAEGSFDWILRSIENYSKYIFSNNTIDWWNYINGGFQIVNKKHKQFFKYITNYYIQNKDEFKEVEKLHVGTDQTPLNFLLQQQDIDVKLLSYEFNMQDMPRKEILDEELTMTKIGWIYHYNCIPQVENESTYYWMKKTYNHLFGQLTKN